VTPGGVGIRTPDPSASVYAGSFRLVSDQPASVGKTGLVLMSACHRVRQSYARLYPPRGPLSAGLTGDNYSRIDTPELFTVLMQTMDRQTIFMQRVHHELVVAFHLLMKKCE